MELRSPGHEDTVDTDRVTRDLLVNVHRSMRTSAGTMVPGSLAIPVVYWWSANRTGMMIGMAIALALSLPIVSYLKRLDVGTHPNPMRALVIANGVANGAWAALPIWMMPEQSNDQYLILALPFAMLVTNLAATAPVRKIYLAGQIPLTVGAMAAFILFADGNTKWAAAVIGVTVLTLDSLGQDWRQTARRSVLLQHKNARLVEDLEETNAVLEHRSRHDHLTGLPNRRAFTDFVESENADGSMHLSDPKLAIMLIDLDNFKAVNDQHGHPSGDELLVLVASRLRSLAPARATLNRLGGDEFALAWNVAPEMDWLMELAERVNAALAAPFHIEGQTVAISASIGIALDDDGSLTPTRVLRNADEALYVAKAKGRDRAAAYDESSHDEPELSAGIGQFGGDVGSA